MSKTIVVENSFDATAMKKISKSSLNRMRKDVLVELAVKFGWSDSHATKPLNKMIKEDYINFILQMADVFRDDISLDASLMQSTASAMSGTLTASAMSLTTMSPTASAMSPTASAMSPTASAISDIPESATSPTASAMSPTASAISDIPESATASAISDIPESAKSLTAFSMSLTASAMSPTASAMSLEASVVSEPPQKRLRRVSDVVKYREQEKTKKKNFRLSKDLENLKLNSSAVPEETMTRQFSALHLGAVPKKRPPPLNLPLVESVVLDRRQGSEEHSLPQLVESTLPPTRETNIFQFPEKTEHSESGFRLRNAKELSDVLLAIKERNNDDLTTLDDIDSLLSRAFGVVS